MKKPPKSLAILMFYLSIIGYGINANAMLGPTTVHWNTLRQLNYKTGEATPRLRELNKQMIRLPGFVVPLDGDEKKITSFLLVPYHGACIHVPPPPPNLIVFVEMETGVPADYAMQPVWIIGLFQIETSNIAVPGTTYSPEASYKITATEYAPFKWE